MINSEKHVLQCLPLGVVLEDLTEVSDEKTPIHGGAEGHEIRDGGTGNEDVAVLVGRVGTLLVAPGPRGVRGVRGLQILPTSAGLENGVANLFLRNIELNQNLEKENFRLELEVWTGAGVCELANDLKIFPI